jgi:hypothetical protein
MHTREDDAQPALWVVATSRTSPLAAVLAALGSAAPVRELERASDLAPAGDARATVIVDADGTAADDWLALRRWLAESRFARLVLIGDDASRRDVRALLRHDRVRWMSWPPDLEDLRALGDTGSGARASAAPISRAASPAPSAPDARADEPRTSGARDARAGEMEEIERILAASHTADVAAPATPPAAEPAERDDAASSEPSRAVSIRIGDAPDAFRHQVADLADIAQRIEIGLQQLRDAQSEPDMSGVAGGGADDPASDALEHAARDVARLAQFARTLGYLVAPPGPGTQTFDLAELLELFLSEIRTSGPDAPRCLLRSNGALAVRSDRQLLTQAFDALFCLARNSAGRGEIVRVQARRDDDAGGRAVISIDFPAGRLGQMAPEEIVAPYALRTVYPELGANALSAAVRIIEGQGGRCALARELRGRMEWSVWLPLASAVSP